MVLDEIRIDLMIIDVGFPRYANVHALLHVSIMIMMMDTQEKEAPRLFLERQQK